MMIYVAVIRDYIGCEVVKGEPGKMTWEAGRVRAAHSRCRRRRAEEKFQGKGDWGNLSRPPAHLALESCPGDAESQPARGHQPEDAPTRPAERPELGGLGAGQPDAGGGDEGERVCVEHGCPRRLDAQGRHEVLAVGELEDEEEEPDEDPRVGADPIDLWRKGLGTSDLPSP
jgi:hypothetical protein